MNKFIVELFGGVTMREHIDCLARAEKEIDFLRKKARELQSRLPAKCAVKEMLGSCSVCQEEQEIARHAGTMYRAAVMSIDSLPLPLDRRQEIVRDMDAAIEAHVAVAKLPNRK